MNGEWSIQTRNDHCAVTGRPFDDGEFFYTLLFDEKEGFRREDLSVAAWEERPIDAPQPFSLWRSKFEMPPPPPPEPLAKETAEDLLRKYMADASPGPGQCALHSGRDARAKALAQGSGKPHRE